MKLRSKIKTISKPSNFQIMLKKLSSKKSIRAPKYYRTKEKLHRQKNQEQGAQNSALQSYLFAGALLFFVVIFFMMVRNNDIKIPQKEITIKVNLKDIQH